MYSYQCIYTVTAVGRLLYLFAVTYWKGKRIQKKLTDVCIRLFRYSAFYTFLRVTVLIR